MSDHVFPTLDECAAEALSIPEFVANWNRLDPEHPITIMATMNRSPIARMVDEAAKVPPVIWSDETKEKFFALVEKSLWLPTCRHIVEELEKELAR